jgi:hypothetical protein
MMEHTLVATLRDNEAQKRYGKSFRELPQFDRDRINHILEIEAKNAEAAIPPEGGIGAATGLSQRQVDRIGARVWNALERVLPELVAGQVRDALPALVRPLIERAIATSEANTAASVQAAVSAAETAAAAIGKAHGATPESHGRRLERHADHLAGLETRVKKLERGQ